MAQLIDYPELSMPPLQTTTGLRRRRRRRLMWLVMALFLLVSVGYIALSTHWSNSGAEDLQTAQVTRRSLTETISATGSIKAQTGAQVKIGSQVTGRVKQLFVDVGAYVRAGQVIAELDSGSQHFFRENPR